MADEWVCTNPVHPRPCWHGRCPVCGQGVTAFCFDQAEARAEVASHIRQHHPGAAPGGSGA